MDGAVLKQRICDALTVLIESENELRDLDQVLGDGDLGITIAAGSKAVIAALEQLPADTSPADIARASAKAFANANPSTMAALVAGGLLAGSKTWAGVTDVTVAHAQAFVEAATAGISQRGRAQVGDKTIVDGLDAVATVLVGVSDATEATDRAVAAAADAVERTQGLQSQRGRASWLQERSVGHADPGSVALARFLEAWRDSAN